MTPLYKVSLMQFSNGVLYIVSHDDFYRSRFLILHGLKCFYGRYVNDYPCLSPCMASNWRYVSKWLEHSTVDRKSQVHIPPVASQVKCFLYPSSSWETSLWPKGPWGKSQALCRLTLPIQYSVMNVLKMDECNPACMYSLGLVLYITVLPTMRIILS